MLIDKIQLALVSEESAYLLEQDLDFASGILIALISLLIVGFISMGVACCCLKVRKNLKVSCQNVNFPLTPLSLSPTIPDCTVLVSAKANSTSTQSGR